MLDVVRMTIRAGAAQIFPKPRGIEPLWSSVDDPIVYSTPSGSSEAENKPIDPAPAWLHPCNLRFDHRSSRGGQEAAPMLGPVENSGKPDC